MKVEYRPDAVVSIGSCLLVLSMLTFGTEYSHIGFFVGLLGGVAALIHIILIPFEKIVLWESK